jgi:hypothetical protein
MFNAIDRPVGCQRICARFSFIEELHRARLRQRLAATNPATKMMLEETKHL